MVFACNPAGFGGGRFEQKLFEGDTVQTIELQDFPTSYIYERILKDSLYKDGVTILYPNEQDFKNLCQNLVTQYKTGKDDDGNPQTVRKLQEDVMQLVIEEAKKKELLTTQQEDQDRKIVTATYLSTESTRAIETALINSLDARNLQREGFFPKGMGLNAVIFEGQSGAGKSEMIKAVLNYKGIDVVEDENPKPNQKRVCYSIKAGWDEETKKRIIIQAYKEGNAVWIDEINSCLENGLEKILNDALTGKNPDGTGAEKVKPGFMLISSINSSDLEGRSQISPALLQRSVKMDITSPKNYSKEALQAIVRQWLFEGSEKEIKERHKEIFDKLHLASLQKSSSGKTDNVESMITGFVENTNQDQYWENFFSDTGEQYDETASQCSRRKKLVTIAENILDKQDSSNDNFLGEDFVNLYVEAIASLIKKNEKPNLRLIKKNIVELAPYYFAYYYDSLLQDKHTSKVPSHTAEEHNASGAGKLTIKDSLTEDSYKRKSNDWIKEIIDSKTTIKIKDNNPFEEFTESQKKFLLEKNTLLTAESDGTDISVMEAAKRKSGGILDVLTKSKVDSAQPDTTINLSPEKKAEILDYAATSTLSKAIQSAAKEKEREKPAYKAEVTKNSLGFKDTKEHKFEKYADKNFVDVDLSGAFMTRFANCHFGVGCTLPTDKKSLHPKYFSNCTFDKELFEGKVGEELKDKLESAGLDLQLDESGKNYKSSHKVQENTIPGTSIQPTSIASFKLSATLTATPSH